MLYETLTLQNKHIDSIILLQMILHIELYPMIYNLTVLNKLSLNLNILTDKYVLMLIIIIS